jgi:hypothetical protein
MMQMLLKPRTKKVSAELVLNIARQAVGYRLARQRRSTAATAQPVGHCSANNAGIWFLLRGVAEDYF